jgi:coenzyme F420-0:L-glutamate ligase/coenzyme F420-1:gamma-L-glutamate ligase
LKSFTAIALEGFALVRDGDDLPKTIVDVAMKNDVRLEEGDVIVVAQKVFSKAEGRVVKLGDVTPSREAEELAKVIGKSSEFVELVLGETKRVVKASHDILLVEDKRGLISINAGIDKSNVQGRDNFALLPENPDDSAEKCRLRVKELTGKSVGVIISDTFGRAWRVGQVNVAVGVDGLKPMIDYRGRKDMFGKELNVTQMAVADELASAAELVMRKSDGVPVAIIRGAKYPKGKGTARDLVRPEEEDLFR